MRWRRLTGGTVAIVGVLVASLALTRDIFDWRFPSARPTSSSTGSAPDPDPASSTGAPHPIVTATTARTAPRQVNLDTLPVEAGEANLTQLPPTMKGDPAFARSIVIKCPSNEGADRQTEVSYRLSRRYSALTSTIHPYFASSDDRSGIVHVYALGAVRERDDTITETTRGSSFEARMGAPAKLTADTAGADGLTLRVRCQFPTGLVVFSPATLEPAG